MYFATPSQVLSAQSVFALRSAMDMHLENRSWADANPQVFRAGFDCSCLVRSVGALVHDLGGMAAAW